MASRSVRKGSDDEKAGRFAGLGLFALVGSARRNPWLSGASPALPDLAEDSSASSHVPETLPAVLGLECL